MVSIIVHEIFLTRYLRLFSVQKHLTDFDPSLPLILNEHCLIYYVLYRPINLFI